MMPNPMQMARIGPKWNRSSFIATNAGATSFNISYRKVPPTSAKRNPIPNRKDRVLASPLLLMAK